MAELSSCHKDLMASKAPKFYYLALSKKWFANPWSSIISQIQIPTPQSFIPRASEKEKMENS